MYALTQMHTLGDGEDAENGQPRVYRKLAIHAIREDDQQEKNSSHELQFTALEQNEDCSPGHNAKVDKEEDGKQHTDDDDHLPAVAVAKKKTQRQQQQNSATAVESSMSFRRVFAYTLDPILKNVAPMLSSSKKTSAVAPGPGDRYVSHCSVMEEPDEAIADSEPGPDSQSSELLFQRTDQQPPLSSVAAVPPAAAAAVVAQAPAEQS